LPCKAIDVARRWHVPHGREIEEFRAFKDVNFEVKEGKLIGIIVRAGNSMVLKLGARAFRRESRLEANLPCRLHRDIKCR
jgi:ABC-type polysaccharide/polyol phosphate transport system ATPase subunit